MKSKWVMPICPTCGTFYPDENQMSVHDDIPDMDILSFGPYHMSLEYRQALYAEFPGYTTHEIVATFLGYNPIFPSQETWDRIRDNNDEYEQTTDTDSVSSESI